MAELKTKQHDADVFEFINTFANTEQKREDSYELVNAIGKACIYVKRLSDIDSEVLKRLMGATINSLEEKYGKN